MYSALADPESPGSLPHSGPILDDIGGQLTGPLFDISLQDPTLPIPIWSIYMPGAL